MHEHQRTKIAKKLREAREAAGLSQGQVAKLMNKHRPTISEIEAGRRKVKAEELVEFGELYGVSTAWIVSENDELVDIADDKLMIAARSLSAMKDDDFDRLLSLITMLKKTDGS